MSNGGKSIQLYNPDIQDWRITFVDTGLDTHIAQRLVNVKKYLEGEEMFLANYSDGLTDLDLSAYIETYSATSAIAGFVAVRPTQSFHAIQTAENSVVTRMDSLMDSDFWINDGFSS